MAENLSEVYRLDLTLAEVLYESYDLLQVATDGEPIAGGLFNRGLRSLNIMLKLWEAQGIHLWTMSEGSLFLKPGQAIYDFRQEGRTVNDVHLANEFIQRALAADLALTDTTATLDGVTDLAVGDQMGILNADNALEWFLVMGIVGNVVTFDHPVALNTAATGAIIYTYRYLFADALTVANVGTAILDVSDTTLFQNGNQILVLLDTGATVQREVSAVNQGANQITVTLALPSAAAIGNGIVNLTTRRDLFKPVKRIPNTPAAVRRREGNDYEIPIVFQSRDDYFGLPNKQQLGTPIQAYYDRQQPAGVMYLWNNPSAARSVINFTYEREIMIMTNDPTQTFDLPVEWFMALTYNLAEQLIPKVGCSDGRKPMIINGAEKYLADALGFDSAVYPIRMKPQEYG